MKRSLEFDGIRAMAISFIMFCHICFGMGWSAAGGFFGGTFNTVFFLLSAMLLGLNVNKYKLWGGGRCMFQFLFKRVMRLLCSLWPFLIIFMVVSCFAGIDFSLVSFTANMLMLGWFSKLPGLGHLWFVTMILACYMSFAIIGRKPEVFRKPVVWAALCIPLHIAVANIGLPGYFFLILLYCSLVFLYARDIVKWLDAMPTWESIIVTVILNAASYLLIYYKMVEDGIFANYVTTIGGMAVFVMLYKLFKSHNPGTLWCWISGLSYELYLVHHPFCLSEFSLFKLFPGMSDYVVVVLIIMMSAISAYVLKRISGIIYNAITIKSY